jgi:hypothetical protein
MFLLARFLCHTKCNTKYLIHNNKYNKYEKKMDFKNNTYVCMLWKLESVKKFIFRLIDQRLID